MSISLVPAPAPKTCSPIVAAVASLSITAGRPKRSASRSRRGTSRSGRFTDSTIAPGGEVDHRGRADADGLEAARPKVVGAGETVDDGGDARERGPRGRRRPTTSPWGTTSRRRTTGGWTAAVAPARGRRARTAATAVFVPPMSTAISVALRHRLVTSPPPAWASRDRPGPGTVVQYQQRIRPPRGVARHDSAPHPPVTATPWSRGAS